VRRPGRGRPEQEPLGQDHTLLSDLKYVGERYEAIEAVRRELFDWRMYCLEPRVHIRLPQPPSDATCIAEVGHAMAPLLLRLAEQRPKYFEALKRTLRSLVPSVEDLHVDLDEKRGTLDVRVWQDGVEFSSRVVSEGPLRVLALCAIAVSPWGGALVAFEEPENGVHPRRLDLIAKLLDSLATERGRQVVVSTHSPAFCEAVRRLMSAEQRRRTDVAILNVRRGPAGTRVESLHWDELGPLL
jgi:predicted ATPase